MKKSILKSILGLLLINTISAQAAEQSAMVTYDAAKVKKVAQSVSEDKKTLVEESDIWGIDLEEEVAVKEKAKEKIESVKIETPNVVAPVATPIVAATPKVEETKKTEPAVQAPPAKIEPKENSELANATKQKPYCVKGQDELDKSPLKEKLNGTSPYGTTAVGDNEEGSKTLTIQFNEDGSYTARGCLKGSSFFCQTADRGLLRVCYFDKNIYTYAYSLTKQKGTYEKFEAGKNTFTVKDREHGTFNMTAEASQ